MPRRARQQSGGKGVRPVEYNPGQPLERFTAERRRRGVTAESLAYGGAAAGVGASAGGLSNVKLAGTRIGQHTLTQAENKLKSMNHPAHRQVARLKTVGAKVARHPRRTNAAIAGLYTGATGLAAMSRMRAHEEEGISQGIGRIKAGEAYHRTQRHALGKSMTWNITRAGLLAADKLDQPNPRLRRALKYVDEHPGRVAAGVAGAGGAGTLVATSRAGNNRRKQRNELRALSKAAPASLAQKLKIKESFGSPKKALHTIASNPQHVAAGAGLAGGLSLQRPALRRRRDHEQSRNANAATGAAVGGVGGHAAWLAQTHKVRFKGKELEHKVPAGMSRGQRDRIVRAHKKEFNMGHHDSPQQLSSEQRRKFFATYPSELPAAPYKHRLARHHSGGAGVRNQALAIAAGAAYTAGGAKLATRHGNQNKKVAKALYAREERLSPLRVAQFGAGAGLAAWGLGRSPLLGAALARGVKIASGKNNRDALTALQYAMAAQGALRRGTAPGERALRQVRRINQAIERVPGALRPDLAATAGLLLAGNARPVHTTSYRQVSTPVRPTAYGW